MKILDNHIHICGGPCDPPERFLEKTAAADVVGGTVISLPPKHYREIPEQSQDWLARLDHVMEYTSHTPGFLPFLWLDPQEPDAAVQVEYAKRAGIRGIKIICNSYLPESQLELFQAVADAQLPLLFHSGILWNEKPSSVYNRPLSFECLMNVRGLRFALAHVSWPWCDECIALFGKLRHVAAVKKDSSFTMYIDTTPGTPPVYRREVLMKLYCAGYHLRKNILFGSDASVNDYNTAYVQGWIVRDRAILEEIAGLVESYGTMNGSVWNGDPLDKDADALMNAAFYENHKLFTSL